MTKIWKVLEVEPKSLEALLNTVSLSHTIYAVFPHDITVTVVAYQESMAKPKPSEKKAIAKILRASKDR